MKKKERKPPEISRENSVQCSGCQCWLQLAEVILWRATRRNEKSQRLKKINQNDHNLPKTDEEIKKYIDNIYKKFNYIEMDDK